MNHDILWIFANSTGLNVPARPSSDSPWTGPDPTLVRVQVILFTSLVTSLLAAFVAVLGKQWLNRYSWVDMRGSLVDRSRDRQRKMEGMATWRFHLVMEGLPLMLQAALLLLGCALSKYLFTIDNLIAWVVVGFTALSSLSYLLIVIASTVSYNCPFQTPLSLIIRTVIRTVIRPVIRPLIRIVIHPVIRPVIRSVIRFNRKRKKYLKRLGRWLRHAFFFAKHLLRRGRWNLPSSVRDYWDHTEIPMACPSVHPFILFDKDTDLGGYVLDTNCIAWMLKMSMDPDVILDIMKFIPEVVWHPDIRTIPLEKLYDTLLECFNQSSGRPVLIPKFRNKAYHSAKALLHIATQRKCINAKSDKPVFELISRKHQFIGLQHYNEDHDLESSFCMIDRIFKEGDFGPMRWQEFSLTDSHDSWMRHIIPYYGLYALRYRGDLLDDVWKLARIHIPQVRPPLPAAVTMGFLHLIGLLMGVAPQIDGQQTTDRGLV